MLVTRKICLSLLYKHLAAAGSEICEHTPAVKLTEKKGIKEQVLELNSPATI